MSDNIIISDVAREIRENNTKHTQKKVKEMQEALLSIQELVNGKDEAMFALLYYRKWNDIVVCADSIMYTNSALTTYDMNSIKNALQIGSIDLFNDDGDDI